MISDGHAASAKWQRSTKPPPPAEPEIQVAASLLQEFEFLLFMDFYIRQSAIKSIAFGPKDKPNRSMNGKCHLLQKSQSFRFEMSTRNYLAGFKYEVRFNLFGRF